MKTNPLDKDISMLYKGTPPVDRGFVVSETTDTMARIRQVAPRVEDEFVAAETVDQGLKWLLKLGGPSVPDFVVQVLHGRLGEPAAKAAWNLFGRGITVAGPDDQDVRVSVAAFCMSNGTLDILCALAVAGVPPVVNRGMFGQRRANTSMWLDLLCTTQDERSHPQFEGLVDHGGLVELAAVNHQTFHEHALEALELVWALDREHVGFDTLVEDPSPDGAFVRAFVMRKTLEASAAAAPALPAPSAPTTISRALRAGI